MGQTPLHYAVKNDDVDVIGILLNYGADPNIEDKVIAKHTHTHTQYYNNHFGSLVNLIPIYHN